MFGCEIVISGHLRYQYFFSRRVVQCWNDLPACDENFTSLASFKQLLNKVDLRCYTQYGA